MKHTSDMERSVASIERLHRARCIVSTVAKNLGVLAENSECANEIADAEGALLAAAELILQGMAGVDFKASKELLSTPES
jgi:hypothetical protein